MSTLLNAFINVINIWVMKNVESDDRAYDTARVSLIMGLISVAITYTFSVAYSPDARNKLIYHYYNTLRCKRPQPTDFDQTLYYHPTFEALEKLSLTDKCITVKEPLNSNYSILLMKERQEMIGKHKNLFGVENIFITNDGNQTTELKGSYYPCWLVGGTFVYCVFGRDKAHFISQDVVIAKQCVNAYVTRLRDKLGSEFASATANRVQEIFGIDNGRFVFTGTVNVNRTFDTLFYDQKDNLVDVLKKFKANTLYPKTISMDNKLGILLYGPPGTGKTGTISAIANFLQRDLLLINFTEITTIAQLDSLLTHETIRKYIIVFEEFDCILDVLVKASKPEYSKEKPVVNWAAMLTSAQGEERLRILDMMRDALRKPEEDAPINIGYLLQKLDGLEDATGRCIIATTNNPDAIHPALLRPGRFDMKLCLGNCSTKMYEDILGAVFKPTDAEWSRIKNANLQPFRWSPLTVINKALIYKTLDATLRELCEVTPEQVLQPAPTPAPTPTPITGMITRSRSKI